MRRVALGLAALLVFAACESSSSEASSTGSLFSTATTPPPAAGSGFPENVPTDSDGECSVPRTDPARPQAGPMGKITDGVRVSLVDVFGDGPDSVIADFMTGAPPYVKATSGERWVVVTFDGVRNVDPVIEIKNPHARRLPATVCDDSAWAFALAFDREIDDLKLENETAPRVRVFFK